MSDKKLPEDDEFLRKVKIVIEDSETMTPYWESGHEHFWRKSVERIKIAVGGWLIMAIVGGAGAACLVYAVQAGWIK